MPSIVSDTWDQEQTCKDVNSVNMQGGDGHGEPAQVLDDRTWVTCGDSRREFAKILVWEA